jgi:hypothetical protein
VNASIQTPIVDSATPALLFKVGQFIRLMGGETVGRVLEDTDEKGFTKVQIFDDPAWDGTPSFDSGCLTMWTPDVVIPVPASKPVPPPPLDCEKANDLLMKLVASNDLLGNLAQLEMSNSLRDSDDLLAFNIRFLTPGDDDTLGDLLDMISAEEKRQTKNARRN